MKRKASKISELQNVKFSFCFHDDETKGPPLRQAQLELGELHNNSGDQIKAEMQYTAHTT